MLTCKDATQLISRSMDASLPIGTRIRLRLHLHICALCERYRQQLLLIREALQRVDAAGNRPAEQAGGALSEDARERIKKTLRSR